MPLIKAVLQTQLESELKNVLNANKDETDPVNAVNNMAKQMATTLANAIDMYIKSGDVNTTVTTAGSAAAQTGTGVGKVS